MSANLPGRLDCGAVPDGATHMRQPEYITAWLFDPASRWPTWLVEKYTNTESVPDHRIGQYATAVDGEFWRWFNADKFEQMFVPLPPTLNSGAADSPTVDELRETIANEWGSRICYHDESGCVRTCDKSKHCVCADIARAILATHAQPMFIDLSPAPALPRAVEGGAAGYVQGAYDELCVKFSGVHSDDEMDSVLLRLHAALKILSHPNTGDGNEIQSSDGGVEGHAAVPPEIPKQRSGESRDPLGYGSVKVGPHREDAAGIEPGPSDFHPSDGGVAGEPVAWREERDRIVELCATVAEGFDAACNSPRMKLFVDAGLVMAIYKRDGEIGAAIRALKESPLLPVPGNEGREDDCSCGGGDISGHDTLCPYALPRSDGGAL